MAWILAAGRRRPGRRWLSDPLPLDPRVKRFLDALAAGNPPSVLDASVAKRRAQLAELMKLSGPEAPVASAEDRTVPGPAGPLAVRVYTPLDAPGSLLPGLVYLHGGGLVAGSIDTHAPIARALAHSGACRVIAVAYRLAPEHPFPSGLDDCVFAAKWVAANAQRWNGDTSRMAMGGDSAGGNLTAAALAALSAEPDLPRFAAGVLIYGAFDFPALLERSKNKAMTEGFSRAYLGSQYPAALTDPRVSPLRAVKPGALPPCFIICGSADELAPESLAMAQALGQAGMSYELHILEDMPHGFMQMSQLSGCEQGLRLMFEFLRPHVGTRR